MTLLTLNRRLADRISEGNICLCFANQITSNGEILPNCVPPRATINKLYVQLLRNEVVVVVVAVVVVVVIDVGKSTNSGQSPVKYIAPTKYRRRAAQSVPVSSVPPQEHGTVYAKIILVDLITRCFVRLDYRLWYIDLIFG